MCWAVNFRHAKTSLCYRTSAVYAIIADYKLWLELWTLVRFSAKAFRKAGRRSLCSKPRPKTAKSTEVEELCGTRHNHKGWSQRHMATFVTRTKSKAELLIKTVSSEWFGRKAPAIQILDRGALKMNPKAQLVALAFQPTCKSTINSPQATRG